MNALPFIIEMLSEPSLKDFLSENDPHYVNCLDKIEKELIKVLIFMKTSNFKEQTNNLTEALNKGVRLTARKVGDFRREIVQQASKRHSSSSWNHELVTDWKVTLDFISGIVIICNKLKQENQEDELEHNDRDAVVNDIDAVVNILVDMKSIENLLLEPAGSSIMKEEQGQALILKRAFPALGDLKESSKVHNFILGLTIELDNLPQLICKACFGMPLAVSLIGSLLSLKGKTYDVWKRVKDELPENYRPRANRKHLVNIVDYCYEDLPYFLKPCFLYFACYPIGNDIPARSLTEIWIAEGFIAAEEKDTLEETANKYLEQLVQRSLVQVLERSVLGTIKKCRINHFIHEFSIKKSEEESFLVANPDKEIIESLFRLAIHHDNKKQYTELENNHIHSFLSFGFDRNVIKSAVFLKVLELRKSAIPVTTLTNMIYLRYLRLRGSNISTLPDSMGDMKHLQTLDVRDTKIETIPESLWNISALRHVYVKPSPQIKGPPATANITNLQILKTVVVHESWLDNIPQFLVNLIKFAISKPSGLDWKSVSNLLGHMVNLLAISIIANDVPSEFVDTRAFPNLQTLKSIKLEGKWKCGKLFIDNVKFPPNLTKLTLNKSGLKEDPMPRLEKLQALKFLSLQDGAYTGKQMVCSAKGFPQLQSLELSELENLEEWTVEAMGMLKLGKLRVVHCGKLKNLPNLDHVTDKIIQN